MEKLNYPPITLEWLHDNQACEDGMEFVTKNIFEGRDSVPVKEFLTGLLTHEDWFDWTINKLCEGNYNPEDVKGSCLHVKLYGEGNYATRDKKAAVERFA